MVKAQNKMTKT